MISYTIALTLDGITLKNSNLETPPSKDILVKIITDMKITVRVLLRKNVERYEQLALENDIYTDDQLIDFML